jgi:hypothetical protein
MRTTWSEMAHEFEALDADVRGTSGFPALKRADGTAIPVSGYGFDAAAIETLFFRFRASDYVSGNIAVDLDWYADTASSGAVMWGAQIAAITPNTDTQDVETDALATLATVTTTHLGTTGQRLHRSTITITALDSIAPNDNVDLAVTRQAVNAADTMAGDAILVYVTVAA